MRNFPPADELHLQAAIGWLELGDWREANEELEQIAPTLRAHPDVLQTRVKIYVAAERWDYVLPVAQSLSAILPGSSFGPLHAAYAFRHRDRLEEARQTLVAVADKFATDWRIFYGLACFSCRLGMLAEALKWLETAINIAGDADIRAKALDEPDLEELWRDIAEI